MMEQYLLRVPKKIGNELRKKIHDKDINGVDLVAGADNKHFKFHINGQEYPVTLNQLPCIMETHKTYDDNLFYKSGEIGQIFMVHENAEKKKVYEDVTELPSGLTPPTTNIVKRKYAKTKKYPDFPKPDVARVEDTLTKIINGGVIEDVQEELVEFRPWMVTDDQPDGIVVTDEMALIAMHGDDYFELSAKKDENENGNSKEAGSTSQSTNLQTPNQDDSRTPADNLSEEDDDDGNSKPTTATSTPVKQVNKASAEDENMNDDDDEEDKYDLQKDPNYIQLIQLQRHQQKQLSDLDKDINTALASVAATTNFVLKGRFQERVDKLQQSKAELLDSINETNQSIADMEAAANA